MAETGSIISKQERLFSSKVLENQQNPSKFYNQFLYKAVFVSIFLLVVPLFPSQPPEFINQRLHTTSWEILQLIFVGIAVSYGLFSKRNDETEKELHSSKFDNAQSYVSGLLQVSSVFYDETENNSTSYENKVQTWNSQYYRGEPMVVVAPESSVLDQEQSSSHPRVVEKTLFLPVRSLKSRVSDPNIVETIDVSSVEGASLNKSSSNLRPTQISTTFSKSRTGELGGGLALTPTKLDDKVEENIVLRSPIPWRSRSGRMEMNEDMENPFYSLPPPMEESKTNNVEPPKKLSSSITLSSEFKSQNADDLVRRKSFRKSTLPIPPPPPPPPPPQFFHKSPLARSSTSSVTKDELFRRRDLKRSVSDKLSGNNVDDLQNRGKTGEGTEWWTRTSSDSSIMSKYVEKHTPMETMKGEVKGEGFVNYNEERRANVVEPTFMKNRGYSDKNFRDNPSFLPNHTLTEEVLVETEDDEDSDTDDDDDEFEEISDYVNQEHTHNNASDGGPDVDKKADEFIAKFREQIRLQRIASVRKSTGKLQKNTMR